MVWRYFNAQNFYLVIGIAFLERHVDSLDAFIGHFIVDLDVVVIRYQEEVLFRHIHSAASFTTGGIDYLPETVVILSFVCAEVGLPTFVGDTYFVAMVYYKRDAPHEVIHNRLQHRDVLRVITVLFLKLIEVNHLVCHDLNII